MTMNGQIYYYHSVGLESITAITDEPWGHVLKLEY
jgi:hypothetical protein